MDSCSEENLSKQGNLHKVIKTIQEDTQGILLMRSQYKVLSLCCLHLLQGYFIFERIINIFGILIGRVLYVNGNISFWFFAM